MPYATTSQVEAVWRPLSLQESATTDVLVEQASDLLDRRFGNLQDKIDAGDLTANLARMAVTSMVLRVLRNMDGLQSSTASVDDAAETVRYSEAATGMLAVTQVEVDILRPQRTTAYGAVRATPGLL